MNLAVVIGVSDYVDTADNLPGCDNDVRLVETILRQSSKFDDVLVFKGEVKAAKAKADLSAFVEKHKKAGKVEELFFYYTGHGEVRNDDFYFVVSDFDENKPRQTGLTNKELDAMLRSLNPALAVKLVDACHSGITYLKKAGALAKAIEDTKGTFDKCYFMFSSQSSEYSHQGEVLSDFTKAFGEAIAKHSETTIRYQDVVNALADAFSGDDDQTPTFVIQADCTELFCNITPALQAAIREALGTSPNGRSSGKEGKPQPSAGSQLIERVRSDSTRYCDKGEAMKSLQTVKQAIQERKRIPEAGALYEQQINYLDDLKSLPSILSIANYLKENPGYFVKLTHRQESYEAYEQLPQKPAGPLGILNPFAVDYRLVTKHRSVVSGYELTSEAPFAAVRIEEVPKYQSIPWWIAYIAPVFSKVELRLFYTVERQIEVNWDTRELPDKFQWRMQETGMKDEGAVYALVDGVFGDIERVIVKHLTDKYKIGEDQKGGTAASQDAKKP